MATTTKTVQELLNLIDEGDLVLPEIQRDFVWKYPNVQMLFDSLYRGLPIGHMLVWKTKTEVASKRFIHKTSNRLRRFYGYLLDGQQRLTALGLIRHGHEDYPLRFHLLAPDANSPNLNRFYWSSSYGYEDPLSIAVADVLSPGFSMVDTIDRLREVEGYDPKEHGDHVHGALSKLRNILDYPIGITEFESSDYRDATQLFIRFNSTGRKLNKTDLAMAELSQIVPKVVSERMAQLATAYPSFPFTRHFLVQCLVAVHSNRIKLRDPAEIWQGSTPKQVERSWNATVLGLERTIEWITGTVHWDALPWLPSINALIPIIYICARGAMNNKERQLARRWLLLSALNRSFSGGGYDELERITRALSKEPSINRLCALTRGGIKKIQPAHWEVSQRSGPMMSLYVSMLRDSNAKDWVKRTALNGTVIGHNSELQVHHIFPKALLFKHGHTSADVNTFANYAIISKQTNLGISAEEPAVYLKKLKIPRTLLELQCIPTDEDLWSVSRYSQFLNARNRMLADRANSFLGK